MSRYVFCSRAYMFDAAVRRPGARSAAAELELPKAMPPRFRDAAIYRHAQAQAQASSQRLAAGGNATPPAAKGPVVTLLLPSAALQGVVGAAARDAPAAGAHRADDGAPHAPPADRNDLMQVQCQVLNASRFTTA